MAQNILVIGGGGREHALVWKLAASPRCGTLYAAPGNPGIAEHAECVGLDVTDHGAVVAFCRQREVALVIVGPEAPLVAGLIDDLTAAGIAAFGPTRGAARLEGSKGFTKDLCSLKDIPTARYHRFTDAAEARAHVEATGVPIVVKADGLAAGKGVTVAETEREALAAVDACFEGEFGGHGAEIVIEEMLEGEEASLFCICDGTRALPLGTARDHKRAFDRDRGPNTGGMGAISPSPAMGDATVRRAMREIVEPTLEGMREAGSPFVGILYAGLILTETGPKLIEYNVRFGDPECQVLMMRLTSDPVDLFEAAVAGDLSGQAPAWSPEPAMTVVMASKGYPGTYEKGARIGLLPEGDDRFQVFQAGTARRGGVLQANGGRVLAVSARAESLLAASRRIYDAVDRIAWEGAIWRTDIGHGAIMREDEPG